MDPTDDLDRRDDRAEATPDVVMFFLGPQGEFVEDDPNAPTRRTLADVRRAWRAALEVERRQDPYGRNRLAPRPVQGTGRPVRPGYRDEILVTSRSSPDLAVAEAVHGDLFVPPIDRLDVDVASMRSRRYELSWNAVLRVSPWQQRRVQLRLYASPSLNVTALDLSPHRPRRTARASFLRVGNDVMNAVRDRLDDRLGSHEDEPVSQRSH
mgnify:CR=1 FL=1